MIDEAVAVANRSEVVVAVIGEASEMSGESSSRSNIDIPESQIRLLKALKQTGKPLVLVIMSGRPLTLNWESANADAILFTWHAGHEAGNAIADVLFGDVNPSGKLSTSFPRNAGQIPVHYNHLNTGRPNPGDVFNKFRSNFLDVENSPLFPFGYGLSYSSFTYGTLQLSSPTLKGNQILNASVSVTNTGKYDGKEVVQLYIRDKVGSIARPVKELKSFKKQLIKAGETVTVSFTITPADLKFYNSKLVYDWEPGVFEIMVGTNSRDLQSVTVSWVK